MVRRSNGQERIQCHICDGWFYSVSSHCFKAHGVSIRDYKLAYGLPLHVAVACNETIERHKLHGLQVADNVNMKEVRALNPNRGVRDPAVLIRQIQHLAGVHTRHRRILSYMAEMQLCAEHQEGMYPSIAAMARDYNIGRNTVMNTLYRYGLRDIPATGKLKFGKGYYNE